MVGPPGLISCTDLRGGTNQEKIPWEGEFRPKKRSVSWVNSKGIPETIDERLRDGWIPGSCNEFLKKEQMKEELSFYL